MVPVYFVFYFFVFIHLLNKYGSLPPMITTHYDQYGSAVKTLSKQDFALYHVVFAVCISGIFPLIGYLLTRLPLEKLALPNKNYWLASSERREEAIGHLRSGFAWLGIVAGGTVVVINHKLMIATRSNVRGLQPDELRNILLWAGLLTVFFLSRMVLRFRRPSEAAHQERPGEKTEDSKTGEEE